MRRSWLCVGASVCAYASAAPPLGFWPLAYVCLVPLLMALAGARGSERVARSVACFAGIALLATALPLTRAFASFFELSPLACLPAACAIGLLFGGAAGIAFGLLVGDPAKSTPLGLVFRAGGAFVAGEELRSVLFGGLPWLELGQLLAPVPQLAQHAALGGTRLVSFGLVAASVGVWSLTRTEHRRAGVALLVGVGLVQLASIVSVPPSCHSPRAGCVAEVEPGAPRRSGAIRVALVQPALAPEIRRDAARLDAILDGLAAPLAGRPAVDLVVWPENAVPAFLPANASRMLAALGKVASRFVVGAPRAESSGRRFNSALLYVDGRLVGHHDKVHPVPFTETVPAFARGRWTRAVDIDAGAEVAVLEVDGARLGPLICYELLFDDLALAQVRAGAEILLNISHDGYFGGSWGARQHLLAAPLRAIETRRPLLRATSDGLTVAIDDAGRIVAALPPDRPGALTVEVEPRRGRTLFVRSGPAFAWLAILGAGFLALRSRLSA